MVADPEEERISYLLLLKRTEEAATLLHARGETADAKLVKALGMLEGEPYFPDPMKRHERAVEEEKQQIESIQNLNFNVKDIE
mmetsp:Transcript_44909/g.43485  ORF Transcript_44909/g.43485 Transcript_44909/m.43485 type:complete len:83 (-) Transcript_44909:1021-1269(-)